MFLDQAAQFANLDVSFITETLTRQIVASFTEGGTLMADITSFMGMKDANPADLNYYAAGSAAGRLVKLLFDFTINN